MIDNYITKLENKTIISISGEDNEKFLQNLITKFSNSTRNKPKTQPWCIQMVILVLGSILC